MKSILEGLKIDTGFSRLQKLEFWLAAGFYAMAVIAVFSEEPTESGELFGLLYLYDLLIFSVLYLSFLLLNFMVMPKIGHKDSIWVNTAVIVAIIAASFVLIPQLRRNFILIMLVGYFLFKFTLIFLWRRFRHFREDKGNFYSGILLGTVFYLLLMFFLFAGNADRFAIGLPGIILPFAILLYSYSFQKLIPAAKRKKRPFLNFIWRIFLILLVAAVPMGILGYVLFQDEEVPFVLNFFNAFVQFLITVPIAWITHKRHIRGKENLQNLQKELGQSTAKFDFLRSQINPHFLFNALNTLYGTALQEKADRTGEGIQKLGDMMRFMLHENMQEKISLIREIEYLENYISLQKLRTEANPEMSIRAEIQEPKDYPQISPMLLIPFVENAFKHGISFREPSHIKISLEKRENTLYFDVYNSKHPGPDNDPEKGKSGIGLNNVKQRLELLYPGKHELVIRDTGKEYFVHLTLQLN